MTLIDILSALWSERLFLVSLATLGAVGYLNYQALQYKKRKEEPPNFKTKRAEIQDSTGFLSVILENIGPGDCEEINITGKVFYHRDLGIIKEPANHSLNHIQRGEIVSVGIEPPRDTEIADLMDSSIRIKYTADGAKGTAYVLPVHYQEPPDPEIPR